MKVPATVRWLGLAALGMLIAAGVSVAASNLASQQIGLSSEPISAGDALAPAAGEKVGAPSRQHRQQKRDTHPTSPPQTTPMPPPTTTVPSSTAPQSDAEPPRSGGDGGDGSGEADD